jgi:ligand-binding sensor domain-containing protein/tRNA A-37 threonylcarbamoyl transferase component Bud32
MGERATGKQPVLVLLVGVFVLFLADSGLWSKIQGIHFRHITVQDNLPHAVVNVVFQDSRGFMWFGTRDGLARYDGYNIHVFKADPTGPTSISGNNIHAIVEDKAGNLWIGTHCSGLNRFDQETWAFQNFKHDPATSNGLGSNSIHTLNIDSGGNLWIGADNGLYQVSLNAPAAFGRQPSDIYRHLKFRAYQLDPVDCIYESPTMIGVIWLGTAGGGLVKLDPHSGRHEVFKHQADDPGSLSSDFISGITRQGIGTLWIGTRKGDLELFDVKTGTFRHAFKFHSDRSPSIPHQIKCLHQDWTGTLWVGTLGGGISILTPGKTGQKSMTHHSYNPRDRFGISHNKILCVYEDKAGGVWLGTDGQGISYCTKQRETFSHFKYDPNSDTSLSSNEVSAVWETRDGKLWIGTSDAGLNCYDAQTGDFQRFYENDSISCLFEDGVGSLWIGTSNNGLMRMPGKGGTVERFFHDSASVDSLSSNEISSVCQDHYGNIWVGTTGKGLNRLVLGSNSVKRYMRDADDIHSLSNNTITSLCPSRVEEGIVWVGTQAGGLNMLNVRQEKFFRYQDGRGAGRTISNNSVLSLWEDRDGHLWIGTAGGGLNRMNRDRATFEVYASNRGFPSTTIQGILQDVNGNLWISSNAGIIRFNPLDNSIRQYKILDGLQGNSFSSGVAHIGRSGKMYFGGLNGFNAFDPNKIRDNTYIPPVVITSFKVFAREVKLPKPIYMTKKITLKYDQNFFSFEFAALDYTAPQSNLYAYIMEGFDKQWIFTGNRRYVSYTNLDPGLYTLKVKGSNNDRVWNTEGVSLEIEIVPPFWKTGWFAVASFMLFGFISYILIHFARKYLTLISFWKKKHYIGNYRIIEKVGSGGIGIVYKVHKLMEKKRIFALKVLREEYQLDERQKRRFKNEALLADQIDHPHIVKIYERGEDNDNLYIVMEFLSGQSLGDRISRLDLPDSIHIIIQAADVLDKLHKKDIIHRDLTPSNIMLVERDGDPNFVKILDFGLARAQNFTKLTETGHLFGTVAYMPPEYVFHSRVTIEGDLYSLGVIFYEMVTHQKPFEGDSTMEMLKEIFNHDPVQPIDAAPDLPVEINDLILQLMAEDPDDRPSAKEVRNLLDHYSRTRDWAKKFPSSS